MKYAMESAAPKKRTANRRNALKLGLAGIAVVGVGAALTSAAWTDNVWFEADANGATFNLQASLSASGPWTETSATAPLPIPAATFDKLVPGEVRTVSVYVINQSNVPATLTATPSIEGAIFDDEVTGDQLTITAAPVADELAPGASTTVTVTLTVPEEWPTVYKGATGEIKLTVEGKS